MRVIRVCLVISCLLPSGLPAVAAETKPPPGQVVRVPPEDVMPVLGTPVAGPDGKTIGRLVDVLVNAAGIPEAAVIDVGGFMGVGSRKIALHWGALHFDPGDQKQPITLALTLDQIKAAPEYGNPAKPAPIVVAPHARPTPPAAAPAGTTKATINASAPGNTAPGNVSRRSATGSAAGSASGNTADTPPVTRPADSSGPATPAGASAPGAGSPAQAEGPAAHKPPQSNQ
ncbi:MAG TPA: PRC-barrel domain-containing protein [Acetobacteraceae bacterium]|nr:PRC-barrel domain-containing protein [Acetobacteraceae bacterium]